MYNQTSLNRIRPTVVSNYLFHHPRLGSLGNYNSRLVWPDPGRYRILCSLTNKNRMDIGFQEQPIRRNILQSNRGYRFRRQPYTSLTDSELAASSENRQDNSPRKQGVGRIPEQFRPEA